MVRIFSYRGKTLEELQKMSMDQFAKLVKSRNRRALKRMGIPYKALLQKIEKMRKTGKTAMVKTHAREAVILPAWVGMKFAVHNGKEFIEVNVLPEMIGHRLGEFSYTTKHVVHSAPGIRATRGSKFLAVK